MNRGRPSIAVGLGILTAAACGDGAAQQAQAQREMLQRLEAMEQRLDRLAGELEAAGTEPAPDPSAAPATTRPTKPVMRVQFDHQGLRLDGERIDEAALRIRMQQHVAADPNTRLILSGDASVPTETMVELIELAKAAGVKRIAMAGVAEPATTPDAGPESATPGI